MRAVSLLCCALASTKPPAMAITAQPNANLDKLLIAVSFSFQKRNPQMRVVLTSELKQRAFKAELNDQMMRSRMDDLILIVKLHMQWKRQSENGAAVNVIFHCHAAVVCFHDFLDDCKTKTCSFGFGILALPKSVKNALPVLRHYSASAIDNGD